VSVRRSAQQYESTHTHTHTHTLKSRRHSPHWTWVASIRVYWVSWWCYIPARFRLEAFQFIVSSWVKRESHILNTTELFQTFYGASARLCMMSAILLWQIRPSVRPSQCRIVSKWMQISSNSFNRLLRARLCSFWVLLTLQNSKGNFLSGGVSPFIAEAVRDTPTPKRFDQRQRLLRYRSTCERVFLIGVSHAHCPHHNGAGYLVPRVFGLLFTGAHTVWETTSTFCSVIKLEVGIILQVRPRILTRDLFAIANLLITWHYRRAQGGKAVTGTGQRRVKYEKSQWRRYVVKYGGQGQSGQAIKLFQITSYVNDFQTLSNLGSSQPAGALKNYFTFHLWHKTFIPWWCETRRVTQQQFWMKVCDILGIKTYSDPSDLCRLFRSHQSSCLLASVLAIRSPSNAFNSLYVAFNYNFSQRFSSNLPFGTDSAACLHHPRRQRLTDSDARSCHSIRFLQNIHKSKQVMRVATHYAPAPLLPPWASSASRAPPSRRNVAVYSFPRAIRSHGHRCTCLTR